MSETHEHIPINADPAPLITALFNDDRALFGEVLYNWQRDALATITHNNPDADGSQKITGLAYTTVAIVAEMAWFLKSGIDRLENDWNDIRVGQGFAPSKPLAQEWQEHLLERASES